MATGFNVTVIENSTNTKLKDFQLKLAFIQEFIEDNKEFLDKLIIYCNLNLDNEQDPIMTINISNEEFLQRFKNFTVKVSRSEQGKILSFKNSYGIEFFSIFEDHQELILSDMSIKELRGK